MQELAITPLPVPGAAPRVLLVADWAVNPHEVVAAAVRLVHDEPRELGLLVPAWLHGIDWAGDPAASVPCARRQVESVGELSIAAGLTITGAAVGDPDPGSAIVDALADWPADEIVLCVREPRVPLGPFDLARRARRLTGLPVRRVAVLPPSPPRAERSARRRRSGHCTFDAAQAV
jgi:hypothetical protein